MIRTIADLLDALRKQELAAIGAVGDVDHPVLVGDMYEGLTRRMLDNAMFEGLDLRVVDGKIRGADGELSSQLDAMIVVGDGQQLPNTNHFIYSLERVIAVVEVKKSLYAKDLKDTFCKLASVSRMAVPRSLRERHVRQAVRSVVGRELDEDNIAVGSPHEQRVRAEIIGDQLLPVRIGWGYEGYSSEAALRDGIAGCIEQALATGDPAEVSQYAPHALPNLIVARDAGVVKLNGMPYAMRLNGLNWVLYGSVRQGALRLLLEVIWTRLTMEFGVSDEIFGEDLEIETVFPLLEATWGSTDGSQSGWRYDIVDEDAGTLRDRPGDFGWHPVALTQLQYNAIVRLCQTGRIEMSDLEGLAALGVEAGTEEDFPGHMVGTGLVYRDERGDLRLLTDACRAISDPELGYLAADDATGRFSRWLLARRPAGLQVP